MKPTKEMLANPLLADGVEIIAAFAENCSGPGWTNQPLWVIYEDSHRNMRRACLQPDEQTEDMVSMFRISAVVSQEMTSAVSAWRTKLRIGRLPAKTGPMKSRAAVNGDKKCPECGTLCDGKFHKKPNGEDCDMVTTRRGGWRQLGVYDG